MEEASRSNEEACAIKLYTTDEIVTANLVAPSGRISAQAAEVEPSDIVALAKKVQEAHDFVQSRAYSRLSTIAEQIRFLRAQAEKALLDAERDDDLHSVPCNFQKVSGRVYYLYRHLNKTRFFSMVSPQEWGSLCESEFLGAFRLEADRSWTPEGEFTKQTDEYAVLKDVMLHKKHFSAIGN